MIANFWNKKRNLIAFVSSGLFILLDLWGIKTGEKLTINELFVHLIINLVFLSWFAIASYFIIKQK